MTWLTFFAGRSDLTDVMRFVYGETDCRVFEAYSEPDRERRDFPDLASFESLLQAGGTSISQLALWSPSVGSPPVVRRITFTPGAVPGHTHRFATEGCSLIWLQCGSLQAGVLRASRLGWWTEASARRKANPELAPELVRWSELIILGRRLKSQITRHLSRATAGKRPVLQEACALAEQGIRLRDDTQPTADLVVDAA